MHFSKVHNEYTQRGVQLYWQTGKNDFTWLASTIENENVKLASFIEEMSWHIQLLTWLFLVQVP